MVGNDVLRNCSSANFPALNSVEAVDVFHFDCQQIFGLTVLPKAVVDLRCLESAQPPPKL